MKLKNISISKAYKFLNTIFLIIILVLSISIFKIHHSGKDEKSKEKINNSTFLFIEDLSSNINDLTEFSRNYIVTNYSNYEEKYIETLEILNNERYFKDNKTLDKFIESLSLTNLEREKLDDIFRQNEILIYSQKIAISTINNFNNIGYRDSSKLKKYDGLFAKNILFDAKYERDKFDVEEKIKILANIFEQRINQEKQAFIDKYIYYGIIMDFMVMLLFLFFILFYILLNNKIIKPILKFKDYIKHINEGDFNYKMKLIYQDEIGDLSTALNKMSDNLKIQANHIKEIGENNLSLDIKILGDNDIIGKSLLEMKKKLNIYNNKEKLRNIEIKKENWISEGLTKFSDILRNENKNISNLAENIIVHIVNYLDVNQGALFTINNDNEDDIFIELKSAFAYNRTRKLQKRIDLEEGLIGRSVEEKETIYLTDIPKNYIEISSGLGKEKPSSLLIVPLLMNDEVFGVIELASFKALEKHQILFIEKLGKIIASTISSVKINAKTAELLRLAQENAETMASQEEEMRQNMEELQATQESIIQKEQEQKKIITQLNRQNTEELKKLNRNRVNMKGILDALNDTVYFVEFAFDGTIKSLTDYALKKIKGKRENIVGKNQSDFILQDTPEKKKKYQNFWKDLKNGETKTELSKLTHKEQIFWLSETYTPIFDEEGKPLKILNISYDITKEIIQEKELKEKTNFLLKEQENSKKQKEEIKKLLIENKSKEGEYKNLILLKENEIGKSRQEIKKLKMEIRKKK